MHFICIHGVAHGGWCWAFTKQDLEKLGHRVTTPDLPLTSLEDDADAVRAILQKNPEDCVLVGHSYGGLVISKAAENQSNVKHLVYVAAILVAKDEIFTQTNEAYSAPLDNYLQVDANNNVTVAADGACDAFYHCCDQHIADAAIAKLRPTAFACVTEPPGAEPWRTIPSTYVLCSQDRSIAPEFQAVMSKRAGAVITLNTDHSPFYSRRDDFCTALAGVV